MSDKSQRAASELNYQLRPATQQDFSFTRELYINSMQPLLSALGAWNADEIDTAFMGYFIASEIEIVERDGHEIGWLQVSETEKELCLDQIYLMQEARGMGIGSQLINKVISTAKEKSLDVTLSLIKGNPSLALYRRLGFRLVDEDSTKFHMRRRSA